MVVSTVCVEVVKTAYFSASLLNAYSTLLPGGKFIAACSAIHMDNGAWAHAAGLMMIAQLLELKEVYGRPIIL